MARLELHMHVKARSSKDVATVMVFKLLPKRQKYLTFMYLTYGRIPLRNICILSLAAFAMQVSGKYCLS